MMPKEKFEELLELHRKGVGVPELLLAAYHIGRAEELMARAKFSQDIFGPNEETKGLDRWLQTRGGCYEQE